jgi:hypothetical protein
VLMATLSNPSVSQKNPITAALSSVKKWLYHHLMAQY